MSRKNRGEMYFPENKNEKSGNWRFDGDKKDSGEGKKGGNPTRRRKEGGGRSFVLDKTGRDGRGEYKEI